MALSRRNFIQTIAAFAAYSALPKFAFSQTSSLIAAQFGKIPVGNKIQRIVSAGRPSDQLLFALAPEKLLGFSSLSLKKAPLDLFASQWRALPKLGNLAGRGSTLSLETLLELNPDIIIDSGNVDQTYLSLAKKVSEQTHIPYLLVDGGLAETPQQLLQLGALLGVSERAQIQAELANNWLTQANHFAHQQTTAKRFYLARGAKGLQTGLKGSIHTQAIELLGMENVAQVDGLRGLTEISPEQLLLWNPDIIITQDKNSWQIITQSNLWQSIAAVKNKQVYYFNGLPFGWLDAPPGLNRLLGMRRLQSYFDSDINRNIAQDLSQFFNLFYHSPLNDAQCKYLLEHS